MASITKEEMQANATLSDGNSVLKCNIMQTAARMNLEDVTQTQAQNANLPVMSCF